MTGQERLASTILAAIGGTVGGFVGYHLFFWIAGQGFYGMMIPGAFLGLGAGMLARHPSQARGVVCGLAGLALGLYTEWRFAPFLVDGSFTYLLTHVHRVVPVHLIMIVLGGALAYWLGKDTGFGRVVPGRAAPPPAAGAGTP